jgi:hypothetical protein
MSFFEGLKRALEAVVREAPTVVLEQPTPVPLADVEPSPLTEVQKAFMDRLYMEFEVWLMDRSAVPYPKTSVEFAIWNDGDRWAERRLIASILKEVRQERAVLRGYVP